MLALSAPFASCMRQQSVSGWATARSAATGPAPAAEPRTTPHLTFCNGCLLVLQLRHHGEVLPLLLLHGIPLAGKVGVGTRQVLSAAAAASH